MNKKRQNGFTMIEILVVLLIIAVLASLLFPAISAVRRFADKANAATRAQVMVNAIKAYRADYPTYPGQSQGATDKTYDNSDAAHRHALIINALTNNPRKIVISEQVEILGTNIYLDPWGRPYVIGVDENNDGNCTVSSTMYGQNLSTNVQETVAIVSWGSDPSNINKRLYSWIR